MKSWKDLSRPITNQLERFTNFINLLDYAAIAKPAGFFNSKLPFGVPFLLTGTWILP
jgi:Asp-tRNA(Asn)/Glu-tRNA(Gln) amidotransferase A subunit family amidase